MFVSGAMRHKMSYGQISVVVPVKNGANTIGAQLEALANQVEAPPFEIVVSDNGASRQPHRHFGRSQGSVATFEAYARGPGKRA